MAETAFQIQYRQEFIHGFEQLQSLVRGTVTTEAVIKGNQATFLVADSGGARMVTRGVNGLIPARSDNLTQLTATLLEKHDMPQRTEFNLVSSQGEGRRIMQATTMGVMNREIDQDIIDALENGSITTGTTTTASLALCAKAKALLGKNKVRFDGQITALITPAYENYLIQTKEFASADYISNKPLDGSAPVQSYGYYNWIGVKWIVHPDLPGANTSAEKCFMYHRDAVGHAVNMNGEGIHAGYDEQQAYAWARASIYMGGKLLQNNGVVVINHDGSILA